MQIAQTRGLIIKGKLPIPKETVITVRTETTGNFSTISFADDLGGVMMQIAITTEIKKLLKGVVK